MFGAAGEQVLQCVEVLGWEWFGINREMQEYGLNFAGLCSLSENVVADDDVSHGFDHGDGSWEDAGIVPSTAFELRFLVVVCDGWLLAHDGCSGFECGTEEDVFAV